MSPASVVPVGLWLLTGFGPAVSPAETSPSEGTPGAETSPTAEPSAEPGVEPGSEPGTATTPPATVSPPSETLGDEAKRKLGSDIEQLAEDQAKRRVDHRETTICSPATGAMTPVQGRARFRNNAAVGANVVSDSQSSTQVDRLAAAVSTDLKGVEAGIVVAPLSFSRASDPKKAPGWTLLLAALEDDVTRVGTGWAFHLNRDASMQGTLAGLSCGDGWQTEVRAEVKGTVEGIADDIVAVCDDVVTALPAAADADRRAALRSMCHLDDGSTTLDLVMLAGHLEKLAAAAKKTPTVANESFRAALTEHADALEAIGEANDALTLASVGYDEKKVLQSYRRDLWARPETRLAVDVSADFGPREFGFQRQEAPETMGDPPEDEELGEGGMQAVRAGPSFLFRQKRAELRLGINLGTVKLLGTDNYRLAYAPSVAFTYTVAFLGRSPKAKKDASGTKDPKDAYRKRRPEFDGDGNLPARIVLGASASAELVATPPAIQQGPLSKASVLVHADFVVTDKLKFRVGVPLEGKLVEQEASTVSNPAIEHETGVRWTLPAFATTVISF